MPTISAFYGIVIRMFARDHPPPHFHVRYGEHRARVSIRSGELLDGSLPSGKLRDPAVFTAVKVDVYGDTIVWPNGADLDPEVMYGEDRPATGPSPRITTPVHSGEHGRAA